MSLHRTGCLKSAMNEGFQNSVGRTPLSHAHACVPTHPKHSWSLRSGITGAHVFRHTRGAPQLPPHINNACCHCTLQSDTIDPQLTGFVWTGLHDAALLYPLWLFCSCSQLKLNPFSHFVMFIFYFSFFFFSRLCCTSQLKWWRKSPVVIIRIQVCCAAFPPIFFRIPLTRQSESQIWKFFLTLFTFAQIYLVKSGGRVTRSGNNSTSSIARMLLNRLNFCKIRMVQNRWIFFRGMVSGGLPI